MTRLTSTYRLLKNWLITLSQRERFLVGAGGCGLIFTLIYMLAVTLNETLDETALLVEKRKRELVDIGRVLTRYVTVNERKKSLETAFAKSEMTFEQALSQLDRVVKDAVGSDNYELKTGKEPTPFGFDYSKQDYTLNVRSLNLQQLVSLLYRIEQGDRPLFLSKVQISRTAQSSELSAILEIFSIAKNSERSQART